MIALVAYDVSDNRVRGRLHRFLKEFGIRTQKSVFECELEEAGLCRIRAHVAENLDPATDSFVIVLLCRRCHGKARIQGAGISLVALDYRVI
jgi:CRISPR-associated protein Cas2